jgi:predicted MFS family arabinose efflux permease
MSRRPKRPRERDPLDDAADARKRQAGLSLEARMKNPHSPAEPAYPLVAVFYLALASFGSALSLRVTDAQLPRLADELGVSLGNASYVVTAFSIAYGVSQLFFGPLGDRHGKYLVVAWACLGCSVTAALCALAPGYQALLAARLLAGATAGAIIPLSMAWLGDVVPYEQRQPVLARFLTGQIHGLSSGVLVGGFAADQLSWRTPFFCIALVFIVIGAMLLATNRRLPQSARLARKSEGPAWRRMLADFRHVLARPWARVVLLTVFLEGAFLYGAFAFIASHLHRVLGMSLSSAGMVLMLFGMGGLLFAIIAKTIVGRLGESGLALWGGILMAASLLSISAAPSLWLAMPGCFAAGLGFYMLHNTLQTNATQMASERRGAAVASFASSFYMGQSVGVAIAGALLERAGTTAIIALGGVGVLVISFTFSRMRSLRPKVPAM